jgi:hypothetical protein
MATPYDHPSRASNPDEAEGGFNVKVFLITVFVAAIVIGVILLFAAHSKGQKAIPAPTQTTGPNTQLVPPALLHAKPSPLHPATLQISAKSAHLP